MKLIKYNSIYEYVAGADISHYILSSERGEERFAFSFAPIDDEQFVVGEEIGKYTEVNWGENEKSYLLKSALYDEVWGIYEWNEIYSEYRAWSSIFETEVEALNAIDEEEKEYEKQKI